MNIRIPLSSFFSGNPRTLEDDLLDHPRPVDRTPHLHFHTHAGSTHHHEHSHPDDHAHSARIDMGPHTDD